MENKKIVSLKDIVVDFDGDRVLDGLNLDIHDKEFVTFLGPSGCGKKMCIRDRLSTLAAPSSFRRAVASSEL